MRDAFVLGMFFLLSASSAEEPVMGYNDMSNSQLDAMYSKDSSTQEVPIRSAGIQTAAPEAPPVPAVVNDVNAENAQLRAQVARLAAELARRPSSETEEEEEGEDYFGEEGVDTRDSVGGGYDAAAKTGLTDDGRHAVVEKDANGEDQVVVYVQNTAEDATSKHATRLLEQADMYGGSQLASKKGERKSSPLSIPGFGPENFAQEILETAPKKEKVKKERVSFSSFFLLLVSPQTNAFPFSPSCTQCMDDRPLRLTLVAIMYTICPRARRPRIFLTGRGTGRRDSH